jgi:hypothetical protein
VQVTLMKLVMHLMLVLMPMYIDAGADANVH